MKKFLIVLMCLITFILPVTGCSIFKSNQEINQIELQKNIGFFVQTITRIALHEIKPGIDDLYLLQTYLVVGKDLLGSGLQDLETLRDLVREMLPEQYHILAFTVVDVIERFVQTHVTSPDDDIVYRNQLVEAGLDGAIVAIAEYITQKSE